MFYTSSLLVSRTFASSLLFNRSVSFEFLSSLGKFNFGFQRICRKAKMKIQIFAEKLRELKKFHLKSEKLGRSICGCELMSVREAQCGGIKRNSYDGISRKHRQGQTKFSISA